MPQNGDLVSPSAVDVGKQPYVQQSAATLPDTAVDFDNEKVVFSFVDYNKNKCEIKNLSGTEPSQLTETLKKVSKTLKKHLMHYQQSQITCSTVGKSGNYANLYDDLPKDAELIEIEYNRQGRIFGYVVQNIFNITVIKRKHVKY